MGGMQVGELGEGWVNPNHPMHEHHVTVILEYLLYHSHKETHRLKTDDVTRRSDKWIDRKLHFALKTKLEGRDRKRNEGSDRAVYYCCPLRK